MNFAAFQQYRETVLREREKVVDVINLVQTEELVSRIVISTNVFDAAETNLYRALSRLIPPPSPPPEATVHRCHLASEWCACFGFPVEASRRALISRGVRDSLARLFLHLACEDGMLWIPADNYPVYEELARAVGLRPREFPTLPEPKWPSAPPSGGPEFLLITNPLKPAGRYLTAEELVALKAWLSASPSRRLLIDAVYTFDTRFHHGTLELLETGQAILLHSLTKGWLHPRLFGITLLPEIDVAALAPAFRKDPPSQESLGRARELMSTYVAVPSRIARNLEETMEDFRNLSAGLAPPSPPTAAPGYFLTIAYPWEDLLKDRDILGIPASVFGSRRFDLTILSTLFLTR